MSSFETVRERARNLLIYGGITATLGAAMLGVGGAAFAQDASTPTAGSDATAEADADPRSTRDQEYAEFLDDLAANLGVADGETVDAAIKATLIQRVDERLAAGEISADDAEALRAAIEAGEYRLHLGIGGPRDHRDGPFDGRSGKVDRDDVYVGDHADDAGDVEDATDSPDPDGGTPTAGLTA